MNRGGEGVFGLENSRLSDCYVTLFGIRNLVSDLARTHYLHRCPFKPTKAISDTM